MEYIIRMNVTEDKALVIDEDTHKARRVNLHNVINILKPYGNIEYFVGVSNTPFSRLEKDYCIVLVGTKWYIYNRGWYFYISSDEENEFIKKYLMSSYMWNSLMRSLNQLDTYFEYEKRLYMIFKGKSLSLHSNGRIYYESEYAGSAYKISYSGFKRLALLG